MGLSFGFLGDIVWHSDGVGVLDAREFSGAMCRLVCPWTVVS